MISLLEITGAEIAKLRDDQVRDLIGLLFEADYRKENLPTTGITWGGHQDAKDAGTDVKVRNSGKVPKNSFVNRTNVTVQVRKYKMPPNAVTKEMRPNGTLRPNIKEEIRLKGAYIIVSAKDNCATDTMLRSRIAAMKAAVKGVRGNSQLLLDFFDQTRIASWVRIHPAMVMWVKHKLGGTTSGWSSYMNWANPEAGIAEEYLVDERSKFTDNTSGGGTSMDIISGINRMRKALSSPGSFRLVGLSGVGKTRLAQALFDERIGQGALAQTSVVYTDIGQPPNPTPVSMMEQLGAIGFTGIVIIDNCNPELHRSLSKQCKMHGRLTLLTIEYDVSDPDLPEETVVFELDTADEFLIVKLIRQRYPQISFSDAQVIADYSDGNSRIALALADALKSERSISSLTAQELFERLFYQRERFDRDLYTVGCVCSLVYSFQGEDYYSEDSEIKFLASLCGMDPFRFHSLAHEIKKRRLIQSRSEWRALLPHAIANKLAKDALDVIGVERLHAEFTTRAPKRLLQSFTRRLHYIYDAPQAKLIIEKWFSPGGRFYNPIDLELKELVSFFLVASICPDEALEVMERIDSEGRLKEIADENHRYYAGHDWTGLLVYMAHDQRLFLRCATLLTKLVVMERTKKSNSSSESSLKHLFHVVGSGTNATIEERGKIIEDLLNLGGEPEQKLALDLVDEAFEVDFLSGPPALTHISPRSRGQGWEPTSQVEHNHWYTSITELSLRYLDHEAIGPIIRTRLANKLRILWGINDFEDRVIAWCVLVHEKQPWLEGWAAVKSFLHYERKDLEEDRLNKLEGLEEYLRPKNLIENVRSYVLSENDVLGLFDDEDGSRPKRSEARPSATEKARELGTEVAGNLEELKKLIPELFLSRGWYVTEFGKGLCEAASDIDEIWQFLHKGYSQSDPNQRVASVLFGFLQQWAIRDSNGYNYAMDALMEDEHLGPVFPYLQNSVKLGEVELNRLHQNLASRFCNVVSFANLSVGRASKALQDDELAGLLDKVLQKPGGYQPVIEVLDMRFYQYYEAHDYLRKVGRKALLELDFKGKPSHWLQDHYLERIVKACFREDSMEDALRLYQKIRKNTVGRYGGLGEYPRVLCELVAVFPFEFLDEFMGSKADLTHEYEWSFSGNSKRENPFETIGQEKMLDWAGADVERITRVLRCLPPFQLASNGELIWTRATTTLLNSKIEKAKVLETLGRSIYPSSSSGSRAALLEQRKGLFQGLLDHPDMQITFWAQAELTKLEERIESERKWEHEYQNQVSQSFE